MQNKQTLFLSIQSQDRRRLILLAIFCFFLFATLLVQFYKIQVIEHKKWKRAADRQHHHIVVEPYERGLFYSNTSIRKGHPEAPQPLVMDVPRFHLYADCSLIPKTHHSVILKALDKTLSLSEKEKEKVLRQLQKKSRSRKLVLWMTPEKKEVFFKWWQAYARHHKIPRNALFFVHDYKRAYPFGKLLGQILHTVREERDPQSRICEPTGGLELSLNKYLKGEDGQRMILRSPRQPLDVGQVIKKPRHGAHVYLTINHHLQAMAEEEIKKAVVTAQAKSGWAIVMDPYTGEILAWAQYPQFEPEKYAEYFKDPHQQEASLIKGITVPFEPGSTMKPITLALALKANLEMIRQGKPPIFDPSERIATSSGKFPGRTKPIKDLRTHKYLNFDTALQKSSNIYMGRVVERIIQHLGDEWYRTSLQTIFGFGTRTGIELPAESPGLLPMPGKKHPNGKVQWSKATPYSLAMGYNLLTNSLQMVRCYAVLANGGFDVKPTLIKKIVSHEGEVLFEQTKQSPRRCLEQEVVDRVVKAMRYVTKRGGTASRADIDHYTEAAKTSSTEKVKGGVYSKKIHISTLTGFAPAVNPRIVISIAIDEPAYGYIPGVGKNHLGGGCASPAFKAIGYQTLQYLGVPPDDPNNDSWLKEVKELEGLYQTMNQ